MLEKYDAAFELLGDRWQTMSRVQQHALIGIAEHSDMDFTVGPDFTHRVMPTCHGLDETRTKNCLNKIREIHQADRNETRCLIGEAVRDIQTILGKLENKVCGLR